MREQRTVETPLALVVDVILLRAVYTLQVFIITLGEEVAEQGEKGISLETLHSHK